MQPGVIWNAFEFMPPETDGNHLTSSSKGCLFILWPLHQPMEPTSCVFSYCSGELQLGKLGLGLIRGTSEPDAPNAVVHVGHNDGNKSTCRYEYYNPIITNQETM